MEVNGQRFWSIPKRQWAANIFHNRSQPDTAARPSPLWQFLVSMDLHHPFPGWQQGVKCKSFVTTAQSFEHQSYPYLWIFGWYICYYSSHLLLMFWALKNHEFLLVNCRCSEKLAIWALLKTQCHLFPLVGCKWDSPFMDGDILVWFGWYNPRTNHQPTITNQWYPHIYPYFRCVFLVNPLNLTVDGEIRELVINQPWFWTPEENRRFLLRCRLASHRSRSQTAPGDGWYPT